MNIINLLTEGIENSRIMGVAGENPFKLKKAIRDRLVSNGIKVDELRSMRRDTYIHGKREDYDNDIFKGMIFLTHKEDPNERKYSIDLRIVGDKKICEITVGNKSKVFTEKINNNTVKEFADWAASKYKDVVSGKASIETEEKFDYRNRVDLRYKIDDIKEKIYDIVPKHSMEVSETINDHTAKVSIYLRTKSFNGQLSEKTHDEVRAISKLLEIFAAPKVKRKLDKRFKEKLKGREFSAPMTYYYIAENKDAVYKLLEEIIDLFYDNGLEFTSVNFEGIHFIFSFPRGVEQNLSKPSARARRAPRTLNRREAVREAKKQVIMLSENLKNMHKEIIENAKIAFKPIFKSIFESEL